MEIGSSLKTEFRVTALASNIEATKRQPGMEHETPKNVLDNTFVHGRGEIETRRNKNRDEGFCLGTTWEVVIRKILSIAPFKEGILDVLIVNLKVNIEEEIKYGEARVEPLEKIFCTE
jgi:hypothetical protein